MFNGAMPLVGLEDSSTCWLASFTFTVDSCSCSCWPCVAIV